MLTKIMVPLDGTRFAESALPFAMSLAKRDGAALQLTTVWQPLPSIIDTADWIKQVEAWEESRRAEDRRYMTEVARRVGEALGRTVSIKYLMGRPEDELAKWAEESEIDLVVMATHGHGPVGRTWLGSVADRMVRKGTVPVMLIRPNESTPEVELIPSKPFSKVLVPMDGSELAEKALKKSLLVGGGAKTTEITLLSVVTFPIPMATAEGGIALDSPQLREAQQNAAEAHLARMAEHISTWGCKVTTKVLTNAITWKTIVDFAVSNGFDLIAMATHGRGGAARMLLGSVADKVTRSSPLPTLLFHPARVEEDVVRQMIAADSAPDWS